MTVVSTLADFYLHVTSHSAGGAAEIASVRKESKYSALPSDYLFQPIAFENLGPLNGSGLNFLSEVGRRLSASSQDPRETSFPVSAAVSLDTALQLGAHSRVIVF